MMFRPVYKLHFRLKHLLVFELFGCVNSVVYKGCMHFVPRHLRFAEALLHFFLD